MSSEFAELPRGVVVYRLDPSDSSQFQRGTTNGLDVSQKYVMCNFYSGATSEAMDFRDLWIDSDLNQLSLQFNDN